MITLSELITFNNTEYTRKFFYLYENVVMKTFPDIEKVERIVAYLTGAAFYFYFDRFSFNMMQGQTTPIFNERKRMYEKVREEKIDELCKQVEDLHLMMTKQPRQGPKQVEPTCYKCGKKAHYASQCRMGQEPTCFKCGTKGHRAPEYRSNSEMPQTCTYCHRFGHTRKACFVRKSA